PIEGLGRADAIIVTRCEVSDLPSAIEQELRRWNRHAPIFRASIAPEAWVEYRTGATVESPGVKRVGMFCGLGNPRSFLRTLESIGLEVVDRAEFDDHHRYRPRELRHIAASFLEKGAQAVVTTEKNSLNLPLQPPGLPAPLPLYVLKVGMRIAGEDELLALLEPALRRA